MGTLTVDTNGKTLKHNRMLTFHFHFVYCKFKDRRMDEVFTEESRCRSYFEKKIAMIIFQKMSKLQICWGEGTKLLVK